LPNKELWQFLPSKLVYESQRNCLAIEGRRDYMGGWSGKF